MTVKPVTGTIQVFLMKEEEPTKAIKSSPYATFTKPGPYPIECQCVRYRATRRRENNPQEKERSSPD